MSVHYLKGDAQLQGGVTYAQAMEVFRRFFTPEISQAAPTIAQDLGISYASCCDILDGKLWPAAYQIWVDRVFP